MNPIVRQIFLGLVAGGAIFGITYALMGGKRDELEGLKTQNAALQNEVDKGKLLKASYERLKEEVAKQEKRIEELIKIMPTDADFGEIPYKIKKLADTAGVDQSAFRVAGERRDQYYTERTAEFEFRAGFHTFGQFASQVSGYDKIIGISNMEFNRSQNRNSAYPATVKCIVSAYVYNPVPPPEANPTPVATPKPKAAGKEGE
jgi:type IV pilus assembly protein PilO